MENKQPVPKGLKHTKQRLKIVEILLQEVIPLTAEEIYNEAKKEFNAIALTTIYRNLDALINNNCVNKIMCGDGRAKYEYIRNGHMHRHFLICIGCNKTLPLENCPIKSIETAIHEDTGFQVTGHNLEIYGYCKDCTIPNIK